MLQNLHDVQDAVVSFRMNKTASNRGAEETICAALGWQVEKGALEG